MRQETKRAEERYCFGPFRISVDERVLWRDGSIVPLTPKCFDTLLVLAQHHGSVVEKETLMREVWPDSFVEQGNLAQNIFTLRKTLGELPEGGQYIQTIPKRGYRLVLPPAESHPAPGPPSAVPADIPSQRALTRIAFYAVVAAMTVSSTVMAAHWILSSPGERSVPSTRFTLLSVPNNVAYGILSADGQHIAYVSVDAGGQSLWVRETGAVGAGNRLVPPVQGHFWGVSYSPKGEYLYYIFESETRPAEGILYRVPAQGGDPQELLTDAASAPSFSPDGGRMVLKRYDANGRGYLFTATAAGANIRTIARSDASHPFYSYWWAAEGNRIDYVEGRRTSNGSDWFLMEIPANGGASKVVLGPHPRALRSVVWLGRADALALIPEADSGLAQIWEAGPGSRFRRLTNDTNDYSLISLTADARTVLANSVTTNDSIWTAPAPATGRNQPVRMSLPTGTYNDPVWTPDGHVVFVGLSNIWLSSADGLERRPLLSERLIASEPAVSADGRSVVFVSEGHAGRNLWRIGIDGAGLRQVTTGPYDWHPALSADGKWVLYASQTPGHRALWKAPLDRDGSPVKLADNGATSLAVSPDGKWFAYRTDSGEIDVRSFEDGAAVRTLTTSTDPTDIYWSRDGKALTYVTHWGRSVQFWSQPIAGGPPTHIGTPLPSEVVTVKCSRDLRRIVYLRREIKVQLALIGNLR